MFERKGLLEAQASAGGPGRPSLGASLLAGVDAWKCTLDFLPGAGCSRRDLGFPDCPACDLSQKDESSSSCRKRPAAATYGVRTRGILSGEENPFKSGRSETLGALLSKYRTSCIQASPTERR